MLSSGDDPVHREVASVFLFGRIESDDMSGAATVSGVLRVVSFAMLLLVGWYLDGAPRVPGEPRA